VTHEPAPQIEGSKPPFDPIFPRLVNEADDAGQKLIGFIAYGLYHEAQREWISDFRTREGRYPNDEELRGYERSWIPSRLEALRNAAVQAIAAYTDSIVSQAETQILRNALNGSFSRTVWRWVVGALLYTIIVIGVVVGLNRSGIDLTALLTR
jgi:small-conductance mechanosensitive channel